MAGTFFSDLITKVNTVCDGFVLSKAAAVMGSISGAATTLFCIYVMLWALAMMRGSIQEPIFDAAMRMVRIGIVMGVALSLGNYQRFVYDFLWNAPDQMAQIIAGSSSGSQTNVLDAIYNKTMEVGDRAYDEIGLTSGIGPSIGYAIVAAVTYAAGFALTGYAAFLIILCKIALATILAIGPICITLVMFNATQKFFESWLGMAMNYVFLTILVGAAVSLLQTILGNFINNIVSSAEIKIGDAVQLLIVGVISVLVLKQVPSIASSIGGGAAISTMGAVQGFMRGAMNQFSRKPRYQKDASGKRVLSHYSSNAERLGSAPISAAKGTYRAARNLYRNSRKNSVSNG